MSQISIPATIHYCWFGGSPLPKSAERCIASWKMYFPDWEIRVWNEDHFDVKMIPYTREAYERKKYAFVSDYARFYILYHYGGLYFDTDVEMIRPMDDIAARGPFMGIEQSTHTVGVNPGLGMGAVPGMAFYKDMLDYYADLHFVDEYGVQLPGTIVKHTTDRLCRYGFHPENEQQQVAGIQIYPNDWFNPLDDATGRVVITENTRSIHHYAKTWIEHYGPLRIWITRRLHRIFGVDTLRRLRNIFVSD